jgi:hypothetical protein
MSAQVEIHITTLPDVISAPVQAVAGTADKPAVFVWKAGKVERRDVELGLASEHYVEIKSGVSVGERLLLDPPREERATNGGENGAGGEAADPEGMPAAPKAKGRPGGASKRKQPGARGGEKGRPATAESTSSGMKRSAPKRGGGANGR